MPSSLDLIVHGELFYTYQVPPTTKLPPELLDLLISPPAISTFVSISRTPAEISIVTNFKLETTIVSTTEGIKDATPWRCMSIRGPMEFNLTGIMCNLTTPLKVAEVLDTDYLLIPADEDKVHKAIEALKKDWTIVIAS
ncbi:hypothetical protein BS47DRAFT_1335082 [Hydnum rufescens UP504]|uniref:CASTOR ACT domain-containing protein n=1 Tax=Hydnum rufescens UP504 TaxID=1448309 RepID=A0A9P6BBK6_9AGAM|nr:hypothetical protein BS47DRAFT_1335082 [Hydnum rufescens UP504]